MPEVASAAMRAFASSPPANGPSHMQLPAGASSPHREHNAAAGYGRDTTAVHFFPVASNVFRHAQSAPKGADGNACQLGVAQLPTAAATCSTAVGALSLTPPTSVSAAISQLTEKQTSKPATHTAAAGESRHGHEVTAKAVISTSSRQHPQLGTDRAGLPLSDSVSSQPARDADDIKVSEQELGNSKREHTRNLLLSIEKALHLVLPDTRHEKGENLDQPEASGHSCGQGLVRVAYRQDEHWASTPAVVLTAGSGAVWEHQVHLDLPQQDTGSCDMQSLQVSTFA